MSTPHGCTDDSDVIETFKEALKQRVGHERFQIWFSGVRFEVESGDEPEGSILPPQSIIVTTAGQFAADRLAKHYLSAMRGAAAAVFGRSIAVTIQVNHLPAQQVDLPFREEDLASESGLSSASNANRNSDAVNHSKTRSGNHSIVSRPRGARSLGAVLRDGTDSRQGSSSRKGSNHRSSHVQSESRVSLDDTAEDAATTAAPQATASHRGEFTWENFFGGQCNELARAACKMAIENPALASPLVLWGPPGSGKTHLLNAVAGKLRGLHRMRRVVYLSAEAFTNDFIKALNGSCLPAFRSRFRDADALLIDDIQFFVEKKATIRELHHTIEMLAEVGKPLVFAGTKAPSEINGLGGELSGRLASGLVCQVESLDSQTRMQLLTRYAEQRCPFPWPQSTLTEIADTAGGDGRLLSGIVNLVALLQRMHGHMPTMDQIRLNGSHLLRAAGVPITLSAIERAVEKVFQLESKSLQSGSQTKSVTEPRMLAMYLAREMTSSAFSEIGGHFGGRSHSTAILANQRVRQWLDAGRSVGRGRAAISTDEALRRIEAMLKTG